MPCDDLRPIGTANAQTFTTETLSITSHYPSQCAEELRITALIKATEENIAKYQERDKIAKQRKQNEDEDLDDFMSHLSSEKELDKTEIKNLRVR